jgi:urease accessory protein
MTWHAHLHLDYRLQAGRTVVHHQHQGPLRVLQSLYPEGDAICHNVLVHPPGGLVGGDTLDIQAQVGPGAHALITTPGATRFYRSEGPLALQRTQLTLAAGARLEWLPLEALCYNACHAQNHITLNLEPGADLLGWDVTALGLPGADLPFERGQLVQHIELPGVWLERARINAADQRLLPSPLGLAGHQCIASLFWASGSPISREQREAALQAARDLIAPHELAATSAATSPNPQVIIVRTLAPLVEPAMDLLQRIRAAWRHTVWGLPGVKPRIWAM